MLKSLLSISLLVALAATQMFESELTRREILLEAEMDYLEARAELLEARSDLQEVIQRRELNKAVRALRAETTLPAKNTCAMNRSFRTIMCYTGKPGLYAYSTADCQGKKAGEPCGELQTEFTPFNEHSRQKLRFGFKEPRDE